MRTHILLVEDDPTLRMLTAAYLRREFEVAEASDAAEARARYAGLRPGGMVIDIGLPDGSGLDLGRRIRMRDPGIGIIFLTSADDQQTKLAGFGVGADDYLTKPFDPEELIARLRAVLRRRAAGTADEAGPLHLGSLVIDLARREVFDRLGSQASLSRAEFDVLAALAAGRGTILTRAQLLDAVSVDPGHEAGERSIDVIVSNLRRKLGALAGGDAPILTVRGLGYRGRTDA